ncbi:hypothetical protein N7519_008080 [Penicillium mononematosum]|uniref:uncharacterized protein n=1 Tax=Penicillium mononematosum TaxID=268346 RepID=UPI0025491C1A|nr:uncharacterized protein N7519_008080 [Penicillium mononematosum]KAJ6186779.1 hypothetical protein N7519_008080 [Penicillium mononematosum]
MPTRLVISGYLDLRGTLLEQKAEAEHCHDNIRRSVLHEPRGHADMFGAILRPETEFTKTGEAHMGVLYIHGNGYSNMCGHATIAICRFLIDTCDLSIFPRRNDIDYDTNTQTASLILHTPGGLINATIPTTDNGNRSDPTRPIKFIALPAYAIATEIKVFIPPKIGGSSLAHERL